MLNNLAQTTVAVQGQVEQESKWEVTSASLEAINDTFYVFGELPAECRNTNLIDIARYLTSKAGHIPFTIDQLEELEARDVLPRNAESDLAMGYYLPELLKSLSAWMQVAESLTHGRDGQYANPLFRSHAAKSKLLLGDVLASFSNAWAQTICFVPAYTTESTAPGIELLKRYRRFTRHVCEFAEAVWPELNWARLRARP